MSDLVWVRLTADADWQVAARDPDSDGWLVIGVPTPVHPAVVGESVSLQRPQEAWADGDLDNGTFLAAVRR